MKRFHLLCALLAFTAAPLLAQAQDDDSIPRLGRRDNDGPRIGIAYISGPAAEAKLAERGLNPVMSLFGWHFEHVIRPQGGGPMLVSQVALMVAGLEQGTAIPSATVILGIRLPSDVEFGMV